MAEFFQTVHLREEFFPLINPRVAAVRVHRQRVYTCKIHSCEAGPWLKSGAERRGSRPGLEARTCCLCRRRGSPNPGTQGSRASGTVMTGLEKKAPPLKHPQNQSKVAGGNQPRREPGVSFIFPKTNRKTLPEVHFYCVPKPKRKQEKKKKK